MTSSAGSHRHSKPSNKVPFEGMQRREFLKVLMAAGIAPAQIGFAFDQASGLLTRAIPATGELIPAVGLGTSDEFDSIPQEGLNDLRTVLRQFVDLGGKVVDTAPNYGESERILGELFTELDIADDLFIASKVSASGRESGIRQMEQSERLLGKRPLDLLQSHSLRDLDTQLANLKDRRAEGAVRYIGVTHRRARAFEQLESLIRREPLDFVQFNYSVSTPDAEDRLLPAAADLGVAVIINRPFENGRLFRRTRGIELPDWAQDFDCESWAQFSLKYILSHPAVTCVIPATSDPAHAVDNLRAGLGRLPDEALRRRMRYYMAEL
jgi:aryl-alcohol dehydrogenase-like predicted oxidoreductase